MLEEFPLTTYFLLKGFQMEVMYVYSNWWRGPRGVGRKLLIDIQVRMQQVQGVLHTGAFPTRYNGFRLTVQIKSPVLTGQRGFPAGSRVACLKGAIRNTQRRRKPFILCL